MSDIPSGYKGRVIASVIVQTLVRYNILHAEDRYIMFNMAIVGRETAACNLPRSDLSLQ